MHLATTAYLLATIKNSCQENYTDRTEGCLGPGVNLEKDVRSDYSWWFWNVEHRTLEKMQKEKKKRAKKTETAQVTMSALF